MNVSRQTNGDYPTYTLFGLTADKLLTIYRLCKENEDEYNAVLTEDIMTAIINSGYIDDLID